MLKHLLRVAVVAMTLFVNIKSYAIETTAKQAYMIDATTGQVLFAKNEEEKMSPSSMSKLMTCYMVFEALKNGTFKLDDKMTVSKKAWQMQGSKMFVPVEQQVSIEDLIRGVVVQSGNDASVVLAEGMAGTEEEFANRLNNKAKDLGLNNSNFKNATGWPEAEHYMSAKDLVTLAQRVITDFPEYYKYFSEIEFVYNNISQPNRNILLTRGLGVDGLKSGHTDIAGYGIVVSALRNDRRLILVMNGLTSEEERASEAQSLLNYGFMNFTNIDIAKTSAALLSTNVWLGKLDKVNLTAKQDIIITVAADQSKSIKASANYISPVYAPISTEEQFGTLNIQVGQEKRTIPLYAVEKVEKLSLFKKIVVWFKYLFSNWTFLPPKQQEITKIIY